jgi:putative ABC transport system permease protein
MTRREVYAMILLEAVLLGLLGTLAGLGLGVLLGRGAVQLVTRTINDLFFVVTVREIEVPALTLIKGAVIGVAAALIAAAVPAYEATSVPPAGALQRSNIEERSRRALPWISGGAILLLGVGTLLLIPNWNLVVAFAGLFIIIIAAALLAPSLTLGLMVLVQRVANTISSVIGRMAPRTIVRTLSRTSVAVAALMVSVSVIIGVGVMISSFRATVELWLDEVLQADIFVSPPSLGASQIQNTLDPALINDLANYPGISCHAFTRAVDGVVFLSNDPEQAIPVRLNALSEDLAGAQRRYRAAVGDWQATWAAVEAGGIIVNDPMANRYDIHVGDQVTVQTDRGKHDFPVVGISVDFDVNPLIVLADSVSRQWWDDKAISAIALFVEPGRNVDAMVAELRHAFGGRAELVISSNRGMRENALEVFDRTFAITIALQMLAALVAFIGILSTLMSLQLERVREIGVLRATGMSRGQLWRLSLFETGLIGTSAGLLAIPVGYVLALILIYIINLRSFGWTLEMRLEPREFIQAFLVALIAALAAGLYPAWRMGRIPPAEAVRAE